MINKHRFNMQVIAIILTLCTCVVFADELSVSEVFPIAKDLNELSEIEGIYFDLLKFDIIEAKKQISNKDIRKAALEAYNYVMKFEPDSNYDASYQSYMKDRKNMISGFRKSIVVDSILFQEEMTRQIEHLLFMEFANKPYFDKRFDKEICAPDSLARVHWTVMRKRIEQFNNSIMVDNFNKIAFKYSEETFYLPIGLLLIREGKQFCWYVPIGWEYKGNKKLVKKGEKREESNCHGLGHILGYIYNFEFSRCLYTFQCG